MEPNFVPLMLGKFYEKSITYIDGAPDQVWALVWALFPSIVGYQGQFLTHTGRPALRYVDIQRTNWVLRPFTQPVSNGGLGRDYFVTDYTSLFVFDSTYKLIIQRWDIKSPG
jgi:hypothetical protein